MMFLYEIYDQLLNQPRLIYKILMWCIIDYILCKLFKNMSSKPLRFTSYVLSIINTNYFILLNNRTNVLAYYIYDLIIILDYSNIHYIIHHIITIYLLLLPTSHIDYKLIYIGLKYIKISDLFLWYNKVIELSYMEKNNYIIARTLRIIFISISIVLWIYYRIFISFILLININSIEVFIPSCMLFMANLRWLCKMINLLVNLLYSIYEYYYDYVNKKNT